MALHTPIPIKVNTNRKRKVNEIKLTFCTRPEIPGNEISEMIWANIPATTLKAREKSPMKIFCFHTATKARTADIAQVADIIWLKSPSQKLLLPQKNIWKVIPSQYIIHHRKSILTCLWGDISLGMATKKLCIISKQQLLILRRPVTIWNSDDLDNLVTNLFFWQCFHLLKSRSLQTFRK